MSLTASRPLASAREVASAQGTLDVWSLALDLSARELDALRGLLSSEELDRASRFHFTRDAARFIAGRGQLRLILAALLERDPATLRFLYGHAGKPALVHEGHGSGLRFNLAHSGATGLLAVTAGAEIGVDIECGRPQGDDAEAVARSFFSEQERQLLMSLPAPRRDAAFLRCWTRKEAYVKARGEGLSLPLADFAVTLFEQEPARLRWCRLAGETERWTLVDLSHLCGEGAVAAACVEGNVGTVRAQPQLTRAELARW